MIMDEREIRNLKVETVAIAVVIVLFVLAAIGIFFFYNAPVAFKMIAGILYVGLGVLCMMPHVKGLIHEWKLYKKEKEYDTED